MSYPLVKGNARNALSSPLDICISEKMAIAFFGSADAAYGKTIRFENKKDLKVSGVFSNLPDNASAKFDCLINWPTFLDENSWARDWGNSGPNALIMLRKGSDPALVAKKITHFLDAYTKPSEHYRRELGMQRFGDSYLHGEFKNGKISGGRIEYVRLFSIIAIFILVIACINFMNLSTARSIKRSKEIGIRKVAGATRFGLISQFLTEALAVTSLAILFALFFVILLLPYFNQFAGKHILFPYANRYFLGKYASVNLGHRPGCRKLSGIVSFIIQTNCCIKK